MYSSKTRKKTKKEGDSGSRKQQVRLRNNGKETSQNASSAASPKGTQTTLGHLSQGMHIFDTEGVAEFEVLRKAHDWKQEKN